MSVPRKEFADIISLLKINPRGLNIGEIAHTIGLNRISAAKYLDILAAKGTVEVREMGKAKLYYLSRNIPASIIVSCISGYILVVTKENRVIYANDGFLSFCGLSRELVIDRMMEKIPCDLINHPEVQKNLDAAWTNGKKRADLDILVRGKTRYFDLSVSLVRLPDNSPGAVIAFEDTTRYRHEAAMPDDPGKTYHSVVRKSREIFFSTDKTGILLEISSRAKDYFPTAQDFISRHLDEFAPGIWSFCSDGRDESCGIVKIPDSTGNVRWFEWHAAKSANPAGEESGFVGILIDVTQREKIKETFNTIAEQHRYFLENSEDWIWESDEKGIFSFSNGAVRKMLGYYPEDLPGRLSLSDLFFLKTEEDPGKLVEGIQKARIPVQDIYLTFRHRNGNPVIARCRVSPRTGDAGTFAGYRGICRDITCQCNAEERLKALAGEKDFLFAEIQNRVKNNLQIIVSLLFLQSNQNRDPGIKQALSELQNRIWAISLVYELVKNPADADRISLLRYISALTKSLFETYRSDVNPEIRFSLDAGEMLLDLDTIIPLGLVLNELITNSLLHAFAGRDSGTIAVSVKKTGESEVTLIVSDDGRGLLKDFSWQEARTLGLRLVNNLVDQIGGRIEHVPGPGCTFKISFPVRPECCPDAAPAKNTGDRTGVGTVRARGS
ncbi:MAG: PAS domain S-box protein [Methanoregula sp.]|jgi:PAS domain S-box-containing protein